jgi:hypothetical protein
MNVDAMETEESFVGIISSLDVAATATIGRRKEER